MAESTNLSQTASLPRTDRMPVLLALPMKFSAKQVYLPSSDRLMFLMIKVPSGVTVILQQGQSRSGHPPGTHSSPGKGLASKDNEGEQKGLGWGAAVPAAVDQNLGAFAPEHRGLRSCPRPAGDNHLSPAGGRNQAPYGIQPEVWGQCWKGKGAPHGHPECPCSTCAYDITWPCAKHFTYPLWSIHE